MPTDNSRPYLAPSEWRIFYVLSQGRSPMTIREIGVELIHLYPDQKQAYNTIATIITRMITKGYIREESGPSARSYQTTSPFDDALRQHFEHYLSEHLLDQPEEIGTLLEVLSRKLISGKPGGPH